jgi:2-polyprenyl-3-methyl-5-hydroxy-6-metoxy-1,4-benzoquinol methylase
MTPDESRVASPPSPERLDLADSTGELVHSEHLARYLWAAQVAGGVELLDAGCGTGYGTAILAATGAARVSAIDIDPACVERVRDAVAGVEAHAADVRELPFPDASFDLVVCFEVIEHIDERRAAIRELARVLRPDGTLLISSPNRKRYPKGNEFHVHEYTPEELEQELGSVFTSVRLHRQHAWLASTIGADALAGGRPVPFPTVANDGRLPREELFTVAAASAQEPRSPERMAVLGDPFEVKWWLDKMQETRDAAADEAGDARRGALVVERELGELRSRHEALGRRLLEVEQENAALHERREAAEHDRDEAVARMQGELELANKRVARGDAVLRDVFASPSWRVTKPLRMLKRLAGD